MIMDSKPYRTLRDEDKKWRREEGARILSDHAELLGDEEWLEASKEELKNQIEVKKKALNIYSHMKD